MSYDRQRQHTVVEIRLDLEAFGVDPDADTGMGGVDTSDAGDDDKRGCGGCTTPAGAPVGVAAGLAMLALVRRKTR